MSVEAPPASGAEPGAWRAAAGAPQPPRTGRLHELDLLRVITFCGVIAVHTISFTAPSTSTGAYALLMLLHCTRDVFFSLTAFLLARTALADPTRARRGARRRYLLVAVPYLAWSLIYVVVDSGEAGDPLRLLGTYAADVVMGTAEYHLYFLLVTLQLYAAMPWIVRQVKRFAGRPWPILLAALAVQGGIVAVAEYLPAQIAWMHDAEQQLLPTYLFSVVLGVVAATRERALLEWVRSRRAALAGLFGAGACATVAVFLAQRQAGLSPQNAAAALQPVTVLWSALAAVALLAVGAVWADHRRPASRASRAVAWASDRSFGVYLAHPLVLAGLLAGGWFVGHTGFPSRTAVAYVLVVAGAIGLVEVLRRSPLSLPLTGRPRIGPAAAHIGTPRTGWPFGERAWSRPGKRADAP
ncbi:acyltransferase [Frondihabitans australicus]|uniref:Surface polysaccharide O-acyltransferase-like enzyme n=1 Tax=Frondihabitans australicus TaxID=386892 RepID=A0A495ICM9_9MICO|nr:acyltransferase [Frondihabitans australicus]RKR73390.1 surface polysaccharide O-acyltransferase-like enzyme [Frondihabitans australicus]